MFQLLFALTFLLIFANAQQQLYQNVTARVISEDQAIFLHENRAQETYYLDEDKWYTGGDRIKGDSIRSEEENNFEFQEMRDFYFELKYPKQNDFYITHVSAFIQQSSSLGKAYIVDGGIGYTYMHLIFEAKRTKYFYSQVFVYGRTFT